MRISITSPAPQGWQRRQCLAGLGASLLAWAQPGWSQAYPARPVRFIVPFPAGGPVDTVGRALAQKLTEVWGQQAIVDNKAGAGGLWGPRSPRRRPTMATTCSSAASTIR